MSIRGFVSIPVTLREWDWWIRTIQSEDEFTATLTGYASGPTGTMQWVKTGRHITLSLLVAITGTSNATAMTMTGLPLQIQPASAKQALVMVHDAGVENIGFASISGGTITFSMGSPFSTTGFTASGTKGLSIGWTLHYILDD